MSAYRLAIVQTITTIDTRARYLRNLVVALVVLTVGSIGWAAVTWTLSPLAGLFLLLPLCGLFFLLDAKLLNHWRSRLFHAWLKKDIEFRDFCEAVSAIPMLPKDTLQRMLTTLPSTGDLPAEQRIFSSTATAALATAMRTRESDVMALKATRFAIATGSLIIAVILWMWQPLVAIFAVALLPLLRKWITKRRLRTLREQTLAAQWQPNFDYNKYAELAVNLPCEMAGREKQQFLDRYAAGSVGSSTACLAPPGKNQRL